LSFISAFGSPHRSQGTNSPEPGSSTPASGKHAKVEKHNPQHNAPPARASPGPAATAALASDRSNTMRPASMAFTYQPQLMDLAQDTLPELLPIFNFLNSHSNKLYQEGYFLKLNDLDTRMWTRSRGERVHTWLT
jgi:CCR4-NOT transcriptional complex subunit CAF120